MNRRNIFSLSAITGLVVASIALLGMLSVAAHAQSTKDLVGTWQLVSSVNTSADGTKKTPWGPQGMGIAIFEPNGHFVVVDVNPDIPKFAAKSRIKGTPAEDKAVVSESLAYFGTYSIAGKVITFKIEAATYPNWNGIDQKRDIVTLTGDELKYSVPSPSQGGKSESDWKRIK